MGQDTAPSNGATPCHVIACLGNRHAAEIGPRRCAPCIVEPCGFRVASGADRSIRGIGTLGKAAFRDMLLIFHIEVHHAVAVEAFGLLRHGIDPVKTILVRDLDQN